ncbi:MAG: DUF6876 family protein [Bacteroidota bacterium]
MTTKEREIRSELSQCYGTENKYFNELFKDVFYSDGVREMALLCDATWLLIDSLSNMVLLRREHDFIVSKLYRVDGETKCYIDYEDGNGTHIKRVSYPYTTFPLSNVNEGKKVGPALTMWYQNEMLYLPQEH